MNSVPVAVVEPAYAACYEEYAPRGRRYAYALLRNQADSEEIVQEAFCRLMRSQHDPHAMNGAFAPLFFTTVRNLCIDAQRTRVRRRQVPLTGPIASRGTEPRDNEELVSAIQQAMAALPPSWAEALQLRLNGELSYEQIATVLDCTHAQVRTWIYRARRQLAETFRAQGYLPKDEKS